MYPPAPRARAVPFLLLVLSLFPGLATAAEAPASRPITHEDLWLMKRLGALEASPDGRWRVAAVTEPSYEESQGRRVMSDGR